MGYSTEYKGQIDINPILTHKEYKFLTCFSKTRRVQRTQGPYYVENPSYNSYSCTYSRNSGVTNANSPPEGQPGLWCQWVPTKERDGLVWDKCEKFYFGVEWMVYLIQHFLGINPLAKVSLTFLQGHTLNGAIEAQGQNHNDAWLLIVENNQVSTQALTLTPSGEKTRIGVTD